jgi:branched-chain amino acid transport system permease protein
MLAMSENVTDAQGNITRVVPAETVFTIPFAADANGNARRVNVTLPDVLAVGTAILLLIGLELLVFHTRLGTAMRAVSYNIDTSALMGINVDRIISITFVIGAVLAAAAGFLYAMKYSTLQQPAHQVWVLLGLKAFVAAVVGGIGNIRGATVGGFLIAFIEQFGAYYGTNIHPNASAFTDVYVFALLIIVLLVKPTGLFGSTAREKV